MTEWWDDLIEIDEALLNSTKCCCRCEIAKPHNAFSKDKSKSDGLNSTCKDCYSQYHKLNSDSINKRRQLHHIKYNNRNKENYQKWYKNNFDKVRNKHLQSKYGITLSQFNSMVKQQNGKCKICESELDNGKGTHVDHCHETDKIRGILCHSCNTKLGWYQKNQSNIDFYLANPRDYLPSDFMLY